MLFFCTPLLVLLIFVAGCHKPQPVPESDSPPALLYAVKCAICHQAYHPRAHTSFGWETVVERMEKNAETMGMGTLLSEEERTIILGYLNKHARKGY